MSNKSLVSYQLTPSQVALIEWLKKNPYSRIELIIQDAEPVQALVPTNDGLGKKSVLFLRSNKKE